jgi:choline dehydrogenase
MLPTIPRATDTLIIGAGSSGAVIAARVSERSDREVLLVEAGPDYPQAGRLPADLANGTRNSMRDHDWGFRHRPNERQVVLPLPRGKVVGGSSAVNTCIALRGVPSDYDEWAALGLPAWSWERCLPAFKRLERDLDVQNEFHGADGPLPLRRHPASELVEWQAAFLEACAATGQPRCDDHNDPRARGYGPHAMNKIEGRRISAAEAWLDARTRARANLRILPRAQVRRVLIRNGRAWGVEVEVQDEPAADERAGGRWGGAGRAGGASSVIATIEARKIVLCAGAIGTPGILLRSGVGPRGDVARLGVELVSHVPAVGARLLDHPGSAFFLWPRRGVGSTAHPLIQTALRLRSPDSEHENDVQIQAGSTVHLPWASVPLVSLMCQVGKPRGHGTIHFDRADAGAQPIIRSRLLDHADDRRVAVFAMSLAYEISRQPQLRELATPVWPIGRVLGDRARLDGWIRRVTDSGYHPCGTVPMGPEGSDGAALDEHGRVRGVEGLVVADASVMPTIPTANTNLPTLMIGERFGE